MSRIFEALQRSESERADFSFPEPSSLAGDLLQDSEQEAARLGEFPAIRVALPPNSRLVSLNEKESLGAEKFRFLGVRLRQMQQSSALKKVLITSSLPEEGKSLTTGNLAITLARRKQQRVLLLDGDLRRPTQTALFGAGHLPGLSEWLQSGSPAVSNIYFLEGPGFWLMPAGKPPENPLELMQSGKLSELAEQVSAWFDWVLIDSPPILPLADTSVLARLADGVLLVVREGRTQKKQLQRALATLDHSRMLGVVVNNCTNTDHEDYYARYNSGALVPPQDASQSNAQPKPGHQTETAEQKQQAQRQQQK
jgi:capsular exopolysaccharide synthesis family protein